MQVTQLVRYPVKSMGGEVVDAAPTGPRGIEGDRWWAVYTADGGIGSGKTSRRFRRVDGLLEFHATATADGPPLIHTPDGRALCAGEKATDAALTDLLGQPVAVRTESSVMHHDDAPVHVITTASLRRLEVLLGEPVDVRRFRANIVLDVDGDGFAEDGWTGRELALASGVVLALGLPMPRCVMVSAAQHSLPHDGRILKVLGSEHDVDFGLMAATTVDGVLRAGDTAVLRQPRG